MKKKIIIIILAVVVITALGISGYLIYDNNKIVSTVILDINPSVKITLNKRDKVLNVVPINDDAKKIITDDLKGKKLENAIEKIANEVINKGFTNDKKVSILVNTTGKIESVNVEKILEIKFKNKEVKCNVLIQKTDNESIENAKKYNISESKASYIKEIIDNNKDLSFEELKDKSINELNQIKETPKENTVSNPVEEVPPKAETPSTQTPVTPPQTAKPSSSNPPSDPTDKSGVWCAWNTNRKAGSTYYYDKQINIETVHQQILARLNLTALWSTISDTNGAGTEPRSSYCIGYFFKIITTETIYNIVADSVTGAVIEETTMPTPKPKYTEQQALEIVYNYFGASNENQDWYSAYFSADRDGTPGGPIYRYSITINMKDGTRYNASVNAMTGEVYNARTEHY